jgi:hypothetical protein
MAKELPKKVMDLLNDPQAVKILATQTSETDLHIVPLGSLSAPAPDRIIFAKVLMKETHANLEKALKNGHHVSVLAVKGGEAYQVRCQVRSFDTSGPIFDLVGAKMKEMKLPFGGVWQLEPVDVLNQSPGPEAGKHL